MSEEMTRWRVKNAIVEAVQWTGDNEAEVTQFARTDRLIADRTGSHFDALDAEDRANCDDPEATAQLFDNARSRWVLVKDGGWIVEGVTGLFFAVADDEFRETYEPADGPPPPDRDALAELAAQWEAEAGTVLTPGAAGDDPLGRPGQPNFAAGAVAGVLREHARQLLAAIGQPS